MSTTPATPGHGGSPAAASRKGVRSALIGGGIAVLIVAVVLLAHALRGTASPSKSAAGGMTSTTTAGTSSMTGMGSTGTTSTGAGMGTSKVWVVRGATLPVMQTSGAMPVAMSMVPLGGATWEGMTIQARTSAPATFELFNGTSQQLVKPTAKDSFHLMVTLSDSTTNVPIPYSSVWATVTKSSKVVFDERLWPMISRYMGPHYGNNVALPTAGLYHLTLLVSPPVAARHIEYKGLWLKPHRVRLTFRWVPKT
jgi:Fe2+ transport protein